MIKLAGIYSREFVEAVMRAWGEDSAMLVMLTEGDMDVGAFLHREAYKGLDAQEVVDASRAGKLGDLVPQCERRLELRRLYAEWQRMISAPRLPAFGSSY